MKTAILVLWPSFIVGGIGEVSHLSRMSVYSIGFFLCWAFAAASSAFTVFLLRTSKE